MIRRKNKRIAEQENVEPKWFDDFELRLGDMMRGERATLGKSLLDVQRELRIKASYIAAIENCDPQAFDTPGFIAGYVRSYARYLNMDPDKAFEAFCLESGFSTAHGMSDAASSVRKESDFKSKRETKEQHDPMFGKNTPFAPTTESMLSRVEPGAVGSLLVLVALVGALGFGGWTVLNEVQRVQLAPVENTPDVLADLDPLDAATVAAPAVESARADTSSPSLTASSDGFDRLYRPQALDVPVLVARDAPISTLNPSEVGTFALQGGADEVVPVVATAAFGQGVTVVAARPAWVSVKDGQGGVLYSGILNAGDTFDVPQVAEGAPATIHVGESGSIYYVVDGATYGPTGPRGSVTEGFSLAAADLAAALPEANTARDTGLATVLADLGATVPDNAGAVPQVFEQRQDVVTIIATHEVWMRVRSASGSVLYETVMQPGDFYTVPQTDEPATVRAGDAGAIYFAANGQTYGPYGARGAIADNLQLSAANVSGTLEQADWEVSEPLAKAVAQIDAEGAFQTLQD